MAKVGHEYKEVNQVVRKKQIINLKIEHSIVVEFPEGGEEYFTPKELKEIVHKFIISGERSKKYKKGRHSVVVESPRFNYVKIFVNS